MLAFRSKYPIFVAVIKFNLLKSNKMKKTFKTLSFCVSVLRPRLERYLLWKAARKARKLKADGVIIDNKMISE